MRLRHVILLMILSLLCEKGFAQKKNEISLTTGKYGYGPDSIAPVGIIKNISDSSLLDIIQRQTFRYFWHYAHPVSGLARERDNTPIVVMIQNYRSGLLWKLFMNIPDIQNGLKKLGFTSPYIKK